VGPSAEYVTRDEPPSLSELPTQPNSDEAAAARVTYVLPDGERREVEVTTDEVERLRAAGRKAPSGGRQLAGQLIRPASWVAALLLAAIVVPAITSRWNDRPKEVALKSALIQDMDQATALALSNAQVVGTGGVPEADLARVLCSEESSGSRTARERCDDARRDAVLANARLDVDTRTGWRRSAASLDARFGTYFPNQAEGWGIYRDKVDGFLRAPVGCGDAEPRQLLRDLEESTARLDRQRGCIAAIDNVSSKLRNDRKKLQDDVVNHGDTNGFSDTYWDLLGDMGWALLTVILLAAGTLSTLVWLSRRA
jgi:hypothetical protein